MSEMQDIQVGQLDGVVNQNRPSQQLEPNLRWVHQAKPRRGREREIRAVEVGDISQDSPQTITLQVVGQIILSLSTKNTTEDGRLVHPTRRAPGIDKRLDDHEPWPRLDGHQNLCQLQETFMGHRVPTETLTRAKGKQPIGQ